MVPRIWMDPTLAWIAFEAVSSHGTAGMDCVKVEDGHVEPRGVQSGGGGRRNAQEVECEREW